MLLILVVVSLLVPGILGSCSMVCLGKSDLNTCTCTGQGYFFFFFLFFFFFFAHLRSHDQPVDTVVFLQHLLSFPLLVLASGGGDLNVVSMILSNDERLTLRSKTFN